MIEVTRPIDISLRQSTQALLHGRRSVRYYRPDLPPTDVINRILTSAAMAPSAHNRQPWRYVVVTDVNNKECLASVMGASLAAERRRDGDSEQVILQDVTRSIDRITGAPVLIVVAMTMKDMDTYPDELREGAEYLMAVQSTAMATQNLLLAAHAEGLGACWMCAPLFCPSQVRRVLRLSEDWLPQGLVTVGYPSGKARLKPRKAISDFVVFTNPRSDQGVRR